MLTYDCKVTRVPLDGSPTSIATELEGFEPAACGGAMAIDGTTAYIANIYSGMVTKVSLEGGPDPVILASDQSLGGGIAIDGASVYWTGSEAVMKLTPK